MLKIKDLMPNALTGYGLFSVMSNPIWANDFDPLELDTYFMMNYGEKFASPYLLYFKNTNNVISNDNMSTIANLIYSVRKSSWEHLYKDYNTEYNPIYNVDVVTEITEDNTHSDNRSVDTATTDISNSTTSSSASGTNNSNTNNKLSGFNSGSLVNDNASITAGTTGASSGSTANSNNSGSIDTSDDNTGSYTTVTEHHKYGNQGITQNAQMLSNDRNLWSKWSFIDEVMKDICDIIALSIY